MNTNHGLICGELDGCIRRGAANFCQDLTGDQANAFCFNIGRNDLTGAGLVIEACDADLTCGGGNQQTVEYGEVGRNGSERAVQPTASARTSRSTVNFIGRRLSRN